MKRLAAIFILLPFIAHSQSASFDFHSPENIKKFADHLFCEGDFIRSTEEYESISGFLSDDTSEFKIMYGYSNLGLYQKSNEVFEKMDHRSKFFPDAYLLSLKNKLLFLNKSIIPDPGLSFDSLFTKRIMKLSMLSYLYENEFNITREKFISPFDEEELNEVNNFYENKIEPKYKSPALAGILSAVIPGSGKMYVGEWGDGITAFVVTGLFAFLAYDNFRAHHNERAWIFTGVAAFFYAGNVYGSAASAQIFNAKVDLDFSNGLKLFLEKKNYFLPEYDFCK